MYICVIVSTVDVNDCIFCVNEQQKAYCRTAKLHFQMTFSQWSTSSLLKLPNELSRRLKRISKVIYFSSRVQPGYFNRISLPVNC